MAEIILGLAERLWSLVFPPKVELSFERKDFVHWYEEDNSQSNISADMFIINRGKKTTAIREVRIIKMAPDHLEDKGYWPPMTKAIELPPGKDIRYRYTFYFKKDHLRHDEIEVDLEFIHTEGNEVVHAVSKLMDKLKEIRDEESKPEGPVWSVSERADSEENAKIRDRILDYLYEKEINNPDKGWNISRNEMLKHLNIKENLMDFNVHYLKDKHLIILRETPNSPWLMAKITASGIDNVERSRA